VAIDSQNLQITLRIGNARIKAHNMLLIALSDVFVLSDFAFNNVGKCKPLPFQLSDKIRR
jgi:hypothetical protein